MRPGSPHAFTGPPSRRTLWPVMPWVRGNAPVPIVVWVAAVTAGNEPEIALRYVAPSRMRRCRFGHASGHRRSTFHPPPSITSVTTTRGANPGMPGRTRPSAARKSSNPRSLAVVGARSASVTRSSWSCGSTAPGDQTTIGTRSPYIHATAWLVRGSFGLSERDSCG